MRLRKRSDFLRMNHQSKSYVGRLVVIDVRPNKLLMTRLGITVSKRFGKSHERNRFKRIVREAFRNSHEKLITGFDLNIRPREKAKDKNVGSLAVLNEIIYLIGKDR